jgi:Na+/H+ antiporter NhaA
VVAVVWANTLASSYFSVSQALSFGANDIGMAFAVAFLAQEIADATLPGGPLDSLRRAVLPVVSAAGGVVGTVAVYVTYFRFGDELNLLQGWPTVCGVDITFCYLIATSIFRHRSPITFVLLLAIASDVVRVLIVPTALP